MRLVFLFPGQSSRYPQMIERLLGVGEWNRMLLEHASDVLHRDLRAHFNPANAAMFARNRDVQIGIFLANHMFLESLRASGISADISAGLSLGEYNHLVHIGALDFEAALELLVVRGEAYERGSEGALASLHPISADDLLQVAHKIRHVGQLEIPILNGPMQQVIGGPCEVVDAALKIIEEEFFVHGVVIESRLPMHTTLFRTVSDAFRPALAAVEWNAAKASYVPNVLGSGITADEPEHFVDLLARHVYSPVRWRDTIDWLTNRFEDLTLIEVGPGAVLYNLLGKGWNTCRRYKTDTNDDLARSLAALTEELAHGDAHGTDRVAGAA